MAWNALPWENGPGAENNWAAAPIGQIGQWGGNDWGKLTGFQGQTYLSDRDSEGTNPAFLDYLKANGYTPSFRQVSPQLLEYQMFDKGGKAVGNAHQVRVDNKGDLTGLLSIAAMPFVVGNLNQAGLLGTTGGAVDPVASAAAGGFGDGLGVAAGDSLLPAGVGGASGGSGALGFGMGNGSGYITPTIGGAAGGASGGSGLLSGLVDLATRNPRVTAAVVGGILGGAGGQEDAPGEYKGPMPTITRGGWKSSVTPNYMPFNSVASLIKLPKRGK